MGELTLPNTGPIYLDAGRAIGVLRESRTLRHELAKKLQARVCEKKN